MKSGRRICIAAALLLLLAGTYLCYRWLRPSPASISSSGGIDLTLGNWPAEPFYLQRDARWKDETIGGSGERISAVGCTLCCISMAFTHLGVAVTPEEFNDYLKAHDGYNEKGWLKWGEAAGLSKGKIALFPMTPTYENIDDAIRSRELVVAKVLLHGLVPHWVLIVGKEGQEYMVKNPLNDRLDLEKLSSLSGRIESIRIVKAVQPGEE